MDVRTHAGLDDLDTEVQNAILAKCFVPYSPTSRPALHGVPIQLDLDFPGTGRLDNNILLLHDLLDDARANLELAFERSRSFLVDEQESEPSKLPVTVLCSPHLDCLEAVDASVRFLANSLEADIVIMDPSDLAAGRSGVYGHDVSEGIWSLYSRHYTQPGSPEHGSRSPSPNPSPPPYRFQTLESYVNNEADDRQSEPESPRALPPAPKTYIEALVHMTLSGVPPARRRILYLRDFGAFSKALLPLVDALKSATVLGPSRILIIAGLCPTQRASIASDNSAGDGSGVGRFLEHMLGVDRTPPSAGHQRFLERMLHQARFLALLTERYSAEWRKAETPNSRFVSLEHIFTSLFVNRYQRRYLHKRGRSSNHTMVGGHESQLSFVRVVRVALARQLPYPLLDAGRLDRERRFFCANMFFLAMSTSYTATEISMPEMRSPSNDAWRALRESTPSDVWEDITTRVYDQSQLQTIAACLSQPATVADVLSVRRRQILMETAWTQCISGEMNARGSDSVVERVTKDPALTKHEKSLLGCIVDPTTLTTTFDDVCIQPSIIEALRTAVSLPLLAPEAFSTGILASESSAGVLLYGPPGTGKTLACRALAKESGIRMLQIQASNVQDRYVGESEKIVHAIFELARKLGPCIIFIDELDAMFGSRTGNDKVAGHTSQLTEFMQEMDGLLTADLNRQKGITVVGATNRPQDLDSAVIRRLPRRILVGLPGYHERKKIITHYLRGEELDESVNIDALAASTGLYSGSDLKHLVVSAALAALKDSSPIEWQRDERDGTSRAVRRSNAAGRRISTAHFKLAQKEISASCLTDMKGLEALNRWRGGATPVRQGASRR